MITVSKTITRIVERSGAVVAPEGSLVLARADDGRYRFEERVGEGARGWRPRTPDGKRLPPGHVLSRDEAEYAVRALMGLE